MRKNENLKRKRFSAEVSDFKCRGRFTLIELLVVIAIIGILAALLLPALQVAKQFSLQTGCINNQRQVAVIIQFYGNDWGVYPNAGPYFSPLAPYSSTKYWSWYNCLQYGGYFQKKIETSADLVPIKILYCPEKERYITLSGRSWAGGRGDFQMNDYVFSNQGNPKNQWVKLGSIKSPSKLFMTGDIQKKRISAADRRWIPYNTSKWNNDALNLDPYAHLGKMTVIAFPDCHVESYQGIKARERTYNKLPWYNVK